MSVATALITLKLLVERCKLSVSRQLVTTLYVNCKLHELYCTPLSVHQSRESYDEQLFW